MDAPYEAKKVVLLGIEPSFCTTCGARLKPGAKYCNACGTAVEAETPRNQTTPPLPQFPVRLMMRGRIIRLIERFRARGAISPDKAMTAHELGLGPRFQLAMSRRLGRLGIFIEINGKYYLSEGRLKEVRDRLATRRQR
jgi:ribosomal protein L40E